MKLALEVLQLLENDAYKDVKSRLQHHFNGLHLYTKFRKVGMKKNTALNISKAIEKIVHPVLYRQATAS
jgi:hypothetical protein